MERNKVCFIPWWMEDPSHIPSAIILSTWILDIPRISHRRLVSLTIKRNKHTQLVTWVVSDCLMKCPSPWPFPKSHWICSQCNLDCILVPFCHCSTNPFPPLSRRYQIWSEKLHWTEWAKTVIVINVVSCFWPYFKRQGSVGYGSAFFSLHSFPRSTSSEKQMHLCIFLALLKCRPLGETLWRKDHHLLSLITHTPRMPLTGSCVVTPPEHLCVVVYGETGGGRVSCDYFPRSLNKSFWLFFSGELFSDS